MTDPAPDGRPRLRSVRYVLVYVFVCFVVAALLQPLWSRAAGGYAGALAAVSERILPWIEPAPIFSGFTRSGTLIEISSDLTAGKPFGAVETRHFSFYIPFVVLLLCVARWRLRLISGPEVLLILAFLFTVQVSCLSLGALRLLVFALAPSGGFALIGPLEYNVLHTLYHAYGNFGPELWNGAVVTLVLLRGAQLSSRPTVPSPRPPATSLGLAAACAILILPSLAYMTLAPAVRRFTGEATRARMATARQYARIGNVQAAARLVRETLDSNGQDVRAMLLLGSLEEKTDPEQAAAWYEKVLSSDPNQVSAIMGLARVKATMGDGNAAEPLYYTVLKFSPHSTEAYEGLGDIYMSRREYESARTPYELAVKFGPDRPGALLKLGKAHQMAGDPCAAQGFYARSLEMELSPERQSVAVGLVREVSASCARAAR